LPLLFTRTRKLLSFVLLTVASILALELIQAATGLGTFDVDDLILNLTGIGFGFLFWCGFGKTRE
jgi:glycopeptide antibiotics resistance protein